MDLTLTKSRPAQEHEPCEILPRGVRLYLAQVPGRPFLTPPLVNQSTYRCKSTRETLTSTCVGHPGLTHMRDFMIQKHTSIRGDLPRVEVWKQIFS